MKEGIKAITFPAYPSIQAFEKPLKGEDKQYIGEVAEKYLRKYTKKSEADTTYGLTDRKGSFYIGNKPVVIIDNNIIVDVEEEYEGTPGLWDLIVSKKPTNHNDEDYNNYVKLMINNNPEINRPKSSKGDKWNNILNDIWENRKKVWRKRSCFYFERS